MNEEQVWEGSPSQVVNFGTFVVCLLLCWLIVPVFIALWRWLDVRCTRYVITSQRIQIITGVFTRRMEEIEIYRVKDIAYVEPFFYRLFGLGIIELTSSDPSAPYVALVAIPGGDAVREALRKGVEAARRERRTRDIEMADMTAFDWGQ